MGIRSKQNWQLSQRSGQQPSARPEQTGRPPKNGAGRARRAVEKTQRESTKKGDPDRRLENMTTGKLTGPGWPGRAGRRGKADDGGHGTGMAHELGGPQLGRPTTGGAHDRDSPQPGRPTNGEARNREGLKPDGPTHGSRGGNKTGQRGRRCSRGVSVSFLFRLFFSVFFRFFFVFLHFSRSFFRFF